MKPREYVGRRVVVETVPLESQRGLVGQEGEVVSLSEDGPPLLSVLLPDSTYIWLRPAALRLVS